MQTILVCDDDKQIVEAIDIYLTGEGFKVIKAYDGYEALEYLDKNEVDLLIVDVMMPGLDGYGVCRAIRRESAVPILFLTALGGEDQALQGYALGCDDYVTKPFSLALLFAKTAALIRRSRGTPDGTLACGAIRLSPGAHSCTVGNQTIKLSPKEYDLLLCLLRNRGRVLSRAQLLDRVWGLDFQGEDRAVDVQMKNLRSALGSAGGQIKTVFKAGYKLEAE